MIKLHIKEANTTNSSTMTVQDFMDKIEDTYHKYFPNSACFARFKMFMGHPYIAIHCFLAKDKSELSGGYWENDMINISFNIDLPKSIESVDDDMPDSVTLETMRGSSVSSSASSGGRYLYVIGYVRPEIWRTGALLKNSLKR